MAAYLALVACRVDLARGGRTKAIVRARVKLIGMRVLGGVVAGLAMLAGLTVTLAALGAGESPVDLATAKRLLPGNDACESTECLIEHAYRDDPQASALALDLWRSTADVAGVGPEEVMDGGFRGTIHLLPQLPLHQYRKHLAWVVSGTQIMDRFFGQLFPADRAQPRYRWRALQFRFVRSLVKHRPSAYAVGSTVEYNVEGSLNISEGGVRETLFHELFHVNDADHDDWSAAHLRTDYLSILKQCGPSLSVKCLAPYAPNDTLVRGGTFYAFQPNNGDTVHEYAAELAVRYFKEQSELLRSGKLSRRAFKCGPAENARAWQGLVAEFFAGRDLVPPCPKP